MIVVTVARKPLSGRTVAENVVEHGTGVINVDGSRIATDDDLARVAFRTGASSVNLQHSAMQLAAGSPLGRWPANLVLSEEAARHLDAVCPHSKQTAQVVTSARGSVYGDLSGSRGVIPYNDEGGPSRYFKIIKEK